MPVDAASSAAGGTSAHWREAARSILARSQVHQGMCLDWGAESCQLAEALVRQSQLRVLCLCSDPEAVAAARRRFRELGWYGLRIVVRQAEGIDELGLTPHWANLVVSEATLSSGRPPASVDQVLKVLAPTGKAVLGPDQAKAKP